MKRPRFLLLAAGLALVVLGYLAVSWWRFPSDRTPDGAYLRVVTAVNRADARLAFAYLETAAQHACYTVRDQRRAAAAQIRAAYPEPERSQGLARYRSFAQAPDGADVFALYAKERGFLDRLRRDLSGIDHVEVRDQRAVVVTVRGTRYPFRRRENGIWGLTLYTPFLVAEAQRASRDAALVVQAAEDYRRARTKGFPAIAPASKAP